MQRLKVLVACEESQTVCGAFLSLGHDSYSCDLQPCSGPYPDRHIQTDVRNLKSEHWDLIIAHPPCTYLSKAGARWLYKSGKLQESRLQLGIAAKSFFLSFLEFNCDYLAIENPTPLDIFCLPPCSQVIEPYCFGDPYKKRTCLWLRNLPLLMFTDIVLSTKPFINCKRSYLDTHPIPGVTNLYGRSQKTRSKTFPGIAAAMANQWSSYILSK